MQFKFFKKTSHLYLGFGVAFIIQAVLILVVLTSAKSTAVGINTDAIPFDATGFAVGSQALTITDPSTLFAEGCALLQPSTYSPSVAAEDRGEYQRRDTEDGREFGAEDWKRLSKLCPVFSDSQTVLSSWGVNNKDGKHTKRKSSRKDKTTRCAVDESAYDCTRRSDQRALFMMLFTPMFLFAILFFLFERLYWPALAVFLLLLGIEVALAYTLELLDHTKALIFGGTMVAGSAVVGLGHVVWQARQQFWYTRVQYWNSTHGREEPAGPKSRQVELGVPMDDLPPFQEDNNLDRRHSINQAIDLGTGNANDAANANDVTGNVNIDSHKIVANVYDNRVITNIYLGCDHHTKDDSNDDSLSLSFGSICRDLSGNSKGSELKNLFQDS